MNLTLLVSCHWLLHFAGGKKKKRFQNVFLNCVLKTSSTAVETSRSMKLIALPDIVRQTVKHSFIYKTTKKKRHFPSHDFSLFCVTVWQGIPEVNLSVLIGSYWVGIFPYGPFPRKGS